VCHVALDQAIALRIVGRSPRRLDFRPPLLRGLDLLRGTNERMSLYEVTRLTPKAEARLNAQDRRETVRLRAVNGRAWPARTRSGTANGGFSSSTRSILSFYARANADRIGYIHEHDRHGAGRPHQPTRRHNAMGQADGALRFFNAEYRRRRLAAREAGESFIPYRAAELRLRKVDRRRSWLSTGAHHPRVFGPQKALLPPLWRPRLARVAQCPLTVTDSGL
jgi:hypothetical protein